MNCLAVRDRMTEHAIGVLVAGETTAVDRHLQWCAACRKEMNELSLAAGTLAFSVAPAEPPADLADKVSEAIQEVARKGVPAARRGRVLVVGLVAAAMVLSGLGWGAVMAGRASRLQDQVNAALVDRQNALREFADYIKNAGFSSGNKAMLVTLTAPPGSIASGRGMTLMSPTSRDLAVVIVGGLSTTEKDRLPYTVKLEGAGGAELIVGRLSHLDTGGGGTIARQFDLDLAPYQLVEVRDAQGHLVLSGYLTDQLPLPSPAP